MLLQLLIRCLWEEIFRTKVSKKSDVNHLIRHVAHQLQYKIQILEVFSGGDCGVIIDGFERSIIVHVRL